jgi:hypothetical protein
VGTNIGAQLNRPEVRDTIRKLMDTTATADHFRHAGMGEALRYSLGLPPSRYQRRGVTTVTVSQPQNVGLQPEQVRLDRRDDW